MLIVARTNERLIVAHHHHHRRRFQLCNVSHMRSLLIMAQSKLNK